MICRFCNTSYNVVIATLRVLAMRKSRPLADRFWEKVIKQEGCWEWSGAKHKFGYGMIRLGGTQEKAAASRVSWMVHFGEIPHGMFVCHKCDNPVCTNPDHLFLGTSSDNCNDRERKMRGKRRLGAADAKLVKSLKDSGVSWRALARAFNVDRNVLRTAYKHAELDAKLLEPPLTNS